MIREIRNDAAVGLLGLLLTQLLVAEPDVKLSLGPHRSAIGEANEDAAKEIDSPLQIALDFLLVEARETIRAADADPTRCNLMILTPQERPLIASGPKGKEACPGMIEASVKRVLRNG
jgi:hypothetical protein